MQLLLGLTSAIPETFGRMIADIGHNEQVRMRITGTFADEAVVAVVRALEPAGAPFIINYVDEVQSLHVKKATVQTGNIGFRKTVWDLVFKFLLERRGSEFNERMFLASNIRALAQNYNVAYSDILAYFFQSIGQQHQDSTLHVPLFKLLTELIKEDRESQSIPAGNAVTGEKDNPPAETEDIDRARKGILIKDVLLHWLSYGNIPWWAGEYFSWDAAAMFNELLAASPGDAALLLEFAGSSAKMQQRVIYQVPFELTVSLFELYPQGNKAAEWYEFFLTAIITGGDEIPADLLSAGNDLLRIVWDVLIGGQYRTFDQQRFLQAALDHIADRSAVAIPALMGSLRKVLIAAKRPDYKRVLDKFLVARHFRGLPPVAGSDQYLQIEWLFLSGDEQDRYEPHALLRLLDYFLANRKQPGRIRVTDRELTEAKVKQLLSHFSSGKAANLRQLLERAAEAQLSAPGGSLLPASDIGKVIVAHEQGHASKDGHAGYVLKLLSDFLTNGELQAYLQRYDIREVLRYLLTLLYYEKPAALEQLLGKTGHHTAARMMLHDSISAPETVADDRIVNLLNPYAEADVITYIEEISAAGTARAARMADLMASYTAALHRHGDLILALLKRPGIVKHIAAHFSEAAVAEMAIMHPGAFGGREEVSWLSQFQRFIKTSLTDTLLRDELGRLMTEFNLMVLGGHIAISSRADYLKALFAFLSSRNNALYHQVSDAITRAVPDRKNAPIKWLPQVAGQLQTHQKLQEGRIAAEKLLSRAAEIAKQSATLSEQPVSRKKLERQLKEELDKSRKQAEAAEKQQGRDLLADDKNAIYIANAGLVLLAPFLPVYLVRLGLVQAGKFIDPEKQLRAVHLLQYLVTGSIGYPEHELVLNKILCNLPVEEPLPLDIDITEHELEVSDEMLKAVLNSWEKLKNTSIEGFRASFLRRNGALVYKDEAWNLRVEQRGYDVLLQTLPWTIGMIKTPWMDNFLYVEWT
ncbi:MAG: hypothetical protein JSU01_21555, partial [Bacteroidetes bacterium]|nr:hypothetical protein [Bacteroidota bacterium]